MTHLVVTIFVHPYVKYCVMLYFTAAIVSSKHSVFRFLLLYSARSPPQSISMFK